jgi:hypothetical protein
MAVVIEDHLLVELLEIAAHVSISRA